MVRIVVLCMLLGSTAQALTWPEYRDQFLEQDPELDQALADLKLAQAQQTERNSLNETQLVLEPSQTSSSYEVGSASFDSTSLYFTTGVEQKIGYGSLLSLSHKKDLQPQDLGLARVDQEYSLGLSQSLWNNAFGSADRARAKASDLNFRSQQLKFQAARIQSCAKALDLYSDTYLAEQTLEYFKRLQAEADRAHKITERSYRSKLVRKLDWLTAGNDKLQIDTRLIQFTNTYKTKTIELQKYFADKIETPSLKAIPVITEASALTLPAKEQLSYLAEAAKLHSEAQEHEYKARKSLERSDLDFNIELGARQGATPIGEGIRDYNEEFVRASIRWEIPLFNKAPSARVAQSYSQFLISTEQFSEIEHKDNADLNRLQQELISLAKVYGLHTERVQSLDSQLAEAKALLNSGRIEFQDYLVYRNQWFQELRDGLELQKQIWTAQLQFLALSRRESLLCGGAL